MRKVTGTGTIAFELTYLTGTPTTSISTGDRWYTGEENDKPVLVHHTNGTPSNKCTTTIYTLDEVKEHFIWDWDNVPSFAPVKECILIRRAAGAARIMEILADIVINMIKEGINYE
jgi:hypothetical protein